MPVPVSIIGLGRTGLPAAKAFIEKGYSTFGYDIRPDAIDAFIACGGTRLNSPAACAALGGVVLLFVLDDQQLTEVMLGKSGILSSPVNGLSIVCLSTVSRRLVEKLATQSTEAGAAFVDCPFTGGPARIASRSLTLIAAAANDLIEMVRPILEIIGKIVIVGPTPGMGQAVKHCNQLFVGATHGAAMEVITLARKLKLDPALVCSVVGSGIAGSDYFRLLSAAVLNKAPSPGSLGQMSKDMAIVQATLMEAGVNAAVALSAAEYFSASVKNGMQDREGADLITIVEQWPAKKD